MENIIGSNNSTKTKKLIIIVISIILGILSGIISLFGFPERIENMTEDMLYQNADIIPDNIKIIAIDEETLSVLGPYSDWNRSYFAELVEVLNADPDSASAVIGIDVVFSGTNDSESDLHLVNVASEYENIVLASTITIDDYLYQNENGEYALGSYVSAEGKPFDKLAEVSEYGFTNAIYDSDGYVRKAYTCFNSQKDSVTYNSFAYAVSQKLGVATDYSSVIEIAYTGNVGDFEKISMSDVLDGTVPPSHFAGSVVLVGAYEEGLMDSYRVPIDYSSEMYGVELQANIINAILNNKIIYSANPVWQFIAVTLIVGLLTYLALNAKLRNSAIMCLATAVGYMAFVLIFFNVTSVKMNILAVPIGVVLVFLTAVLFRYIDIQKKQLIETRGMLFSMAEAMAEAIDGRTPYNASHTKNVARRCVEMLDYINQLHREKRTELHFSEDDKRQLYLAAMLHDVGKMDTPLEVMDKPTKLGDREKELRSRLEIISLHIKNDALSGIIAQEEADSRLAKIQEFLDKLGGFNCGRPLKDDEWALIAEIENSVYRDSDGNEIPYLSAEERDDLHIKAGTLSDAERTIMQNHVVYTDKILSHMQFGEKFKDVREMAANHHELLNGKGYPNGIDGEKLDTMTRILTIMDIYDALIADDRPYKKPKPNDIAFKILDEEAEYGKIDKDLLEIAKEIWLNNE